MPDRAPSSARRGRWRLLLAGATIVTAWAVWQGTRLRLDTAVENLLPETPAAQDYRTFLEQFGGVEKVFALVTAAPGAEDAVRTASERLATALRRADSVAHVRSGLDAVDEELFLEEILPRALLFADEERRGVMLDRLNPQAVRDRVHALRARLASPAGAWEKPLMIADPLGLASGLEWGGVGGEILRLVDPASGAFLSADGGTALLIVTPRATEVDAAAGRRLEGDLDRAWSEALAGLPEPVQLHVLGGPLYAVHDERTIRTDLIGTVSSSAAGVTLLLVAYFWSARAPLVLALSVACGIAWTAALMSLLWGPLSVFGLAFASILLGLGVDYGIHGAVRFQEWRSRGSDPDQAVLRSISDTGTAIRASAATTMAAFLVLCTAHFAPLRELGLAVAVGLLMTLGASLSVGAPLLALASPAPAGIFRTGALARLLEAGLRGLAGSGRRDRTILVLTVLVTIVAAVGVGRLRGEGDLRSFRPPDHPAEVAETLLAERFGVGSSTLTVLVAGRDLDAALAKARDVGELVRGRLGTGGMVSTPSDWLLPEADARDAVRAWNGGALGDAVATFREAAPAAGLSLVPFERSLALLDAVAGGRLPEPVPESSWPSWLGEAVRVGPESTLVAVFIRARDGVLAPAAVLDLARSVKTVDPAAVVASTLLVGEELRSTVLSELRRLGLWCGLAMAVVVFFSFGGRSLVSLLALLPVGLGAVWVLGLFGWLGIPLDPFSAMMAPVILGIGVDDGLHALHGERIYGDLRKALAGVGPAMALTTLTTCIGFGSLLMSSLPPLRRGGALVAIGTLCCLFATLVVLPAAARRLRPQP